jgi:hypothetical protein
MSLLSKRFITSLSNNNPARIAETALMMFWALELPTWLIITATCFRVFSLSLVLDKTARGNSPRVVRNNSVGCSHSLITSNS